MSDWLTYQNVVLLLAALFALVLIATLVWIQVSAQRTLAELRDFKTLYAATTEVPLEVGRDAR